MYNYLSQQIYRPTRQVTSYKLPFLDLSEFSKENKKGPKKDQKRAKINYPSPDCCRAALDELLKCLSEIFATLRLSGDGGLCWSLPVPACNPITAAGTCQTKDMQVNWCWLVLGTTITVKYFQILTRSDLIFTRLSNIFTHFAVSRPQLSRSAVERKTL